MVTLKDETKKVAEGFKKLNDKNKKEFIAILRNLNYMQNNSSANTSKHSKKIDS